MKEETKETLYNIGVNIIKMIVIVWSVYALLCLYDCTKTTKKKVQNVIKQVHSERIDTVLVHDTLTLASKPKTLIKWRILEASRKSCDSANVQTDTITVQGVKLAIVDTLISNSNSGRAINLILSKPIITHTIHDSVFLLRTDTLYIAKKQKLGLVCVTCFGAGVVLRSFVK
jgi:hypothetical protein